MLNIMDVCKEHNVKLQRGRGACPLHGGKNKSAFSINPNKNLFFCHSCGQGGDAIRLKALLSGRPEGEILRGTFKHSRERAAAKRFKQWVFEARKILINYQTKIYHWINTSEPFSLLWCDAVNERDQLEFYIDCIDDNPTEFYNFYKNEVKRYGHTLRLLQSGPRLRQFKH